MDSDGDGNKRDLKYKKKTDPKRVRSRSGISICWSVLQERIRDFSLFQDLGSFSHPFL